MAHEAVKTPHTRDDNTNNEKDAATNNVYSGSVDSFAEEVTRRVIYESVDRKAEADVDDASTSSCVYTNNGLVFDADFECGNLYRAVMVIHNAGLGYLSMWEDIYEYDLYLQPDPLPYRLDTPEIDRVYREADPGATAAVPLK